jgi:hypothetical protein
VKATIIGMLVCVLAAAVVMVAVALPRLRQGARVLTPTGREQVTDARRRAMALAAQAKERATLVAEQAKERAVGEQADEPDGVVGQVTPSTERIELDKRSPAAVTASPAAEQRGAGQPTPAAHPSREPVQAARVSAAEQDVVDVRAAQALGAGTEAGRTRTLPVAAVPRPAPGERVRPVAGVIPGVSPRAAHRMSSWNPTSTGPRHAR